MALFCCAIVPEEISNRKKKGQKTKTELKTKERAGDKEREVEGKKEKAS